MVVVVSVDTAGPLSFFFFFFFFFFDAATWVAAIVAVALDAGILPVVCRVRRTGGATVFTAAFPMAGSSSSLTHR
jgi:hypothetical protein